MAIFVKSIRALSILSSISSPQFVRIFIDLIVNKKGAPVGQKKSSESAFKV